MSADLATRLVMRFMALANDLNEGAYSWNIDKLAHLIRTIVNEEVSR